MKITRDVITDLLPLYHSREASEDTRALVEDFFQQDPEFEQLSHQEQINLNVLELSSITAGNSAAQQEKETLMRVKRILRLRSILFGTALFCTAMSGLEAGFAVAAVPAWGVYAWTFLALRDTA
jgi:hypothetical protein